METISKLFKSALFGIVAIIVGSWIQWDGRSLTYRVEHQVAEVKQSVAYKQILVWGERSIFEAKDAVSRWLGIHAPKALSHGQLPTGTSSDGITPKEQAELKELIGAVTPQNR